MPRVLKADLAKAAEEAAERIRRLGSSAVLDVPGVPPPPLREGEGAAELTMGGDFHTLDLDHATFMLLWRYVEGAALIRHNNPSPTARAPEALYLKAVRAFRAASGQDLTSVEVAAKKKVWGKTVSDNNTVPVVLKKTTVATSAPPALKTKKVWGKS